MGFEPTTSTLARLRSTTELHPRLHFHVFRGSGGYYTYLLQQIKPFFRKKSNMGKKLFFLVWVVVFARMRGNEAFVVDFIGLDAFSAAGGGRGGTLPYS